MAIRTYTVAGADGSTWMINLVPADLGLDLFLDLIGILSPSLSELNLKAIGKDEGANLEDVDLSTFGIERFLAALGQGLSAPGVGGKKLRTTLFQLIGENRDGVFWAKKDGKSVRLDHELAGDYGTLRRLAVAAVKENYASFFDFGDGLAGLVAQVRKMVPGQS